jgi:hypothetical protein
MWICVDTDEIYEYFPVFGAAQTRKNNQLLGNSYTFATE